jgi:hypothetical protein
MKHLSVGLFILSIILVQGCTYPEPAQIEQQDKRPAIGVRGAPESATLYVDGLKMGLANQYDGDEHVLLIESGKHLVEIKSADGKVIHSETVFLSNSTTKVLDIKP